MRVVGILKRIIDSIKTCRTNCNSFGIRATFWISWKHIFPSYRGKKGMRFLTKWFDKKLKTLIFAYKEKLPVADCTQTFEKIPIWTCWLTGLDTRPELVRICNESVERNCPQIAEVRYITMDNYKEYIEIPEYIEQKYNEGKMCAAHFSDVIRFCLLSKYGGMWLDATVYVTDVIPRECLCSEYYTQRVSNKDRYKKEPSRAQWCGFIWGGYRSNPLFCFVRDSLFWYWKYYDSAIDYIFFDYIIKTAYNHLDVVREMMDSQEPNNEDIWELSALLEEKYDKIRYDNLCKRNIFHKLSYKRQFSGETIDKEMTFWGYLQNRNM